MEIAGTDFIYLVVAELAIFFSGIVRGFSGFGLALIAVPLLSLLLPPAEVVPIIFVLSIIVAAQLLPQVWRDVEWRSLTWLLTSTAVFVPIGAWFLASFSATTMRIGISVIVLGMAAVLSTGFVLRTKPTRRATLAVGALSGTLNGAAAMGGPAIILYYLSVPERAAAGRASIIAYYAASDILCTASLWAHGLIGRQTIVLSAALLPAMILGLWLGSRWFLRIPQAKGRIWMLGLLWLVGVAGLARGVAGLPL